MSWRFSDLNAIEEEYPSLNVLAFFSDLNAVDQEVGNIMNRRLDRLPNKNKLLCKRSSPPWYCVSRKHRDMLTSGNNPLARFLRANVLVGYCFLAFIITLTCLAK